MALPEDLDSILKIKKETHKLYSEELPDIYKNSDILYTDRFLDSFFENDNKIILIAVIDHELVGYSFLEFISVDLPMMVERKYTYIHDLAVSEKHRDIGIGSQMLTYIEEHSILNDSSKIELAVHLFSKKAIRVYERMGFSSRAIRMEKNI